MGNRIDEIFPQDERYKVVSWEPQQYSTDNLPMNDPWFFADDFKSFDKYVSHASDVDSDTSFKERRRRGRGKGRKRVTSNIIKSERNGGIESSRMNVTNTITLVKKEKEKEKTRKQRRHKHRSKSPNKNIINATNLTDVKVDKEINTLSKVNLIDPQTVEAGQVSSLPTTTVSMSKNTSSPTIPVRSPTRMGRRAGNNSPITTDTGFNSPTRSPS